MLLASLPHVSRMSMHPSSANVANIIAVVMGKQIPGSLFFVFVFITLEVQLSRHAGDSSMPHHPKRDTSGQRHSFHAETNVSMLEKWME